MIDTSAFHGAHPTNRSSPQGSDTITIYFGRLSLQDSLSTPASKGQIPPQPNTPKHIDLAKSVDNSKFQACLSPLERQWADELPSAAQRLVAAELRVNKDTQGQRT